MGQENRFSEGFVLKSRDGSNQVCKYHFGRGKASRVKEVISSALMMVNMNPICVWSYWKMCNYEMRENGGANCGSMFPVLLTAFQTAKPCMFQS